MQVGDVLSMGSFFLMAFAAAVSVIVAGSISLHFELRWSRWFIPAVVPLIGLGIVISTLFSGRNLAFASLDISLISAGVGDAGSWLLRGFTFLIVVISVARWMGGIFRRQGQSFAPGTGLFLAFAAFFLTNNVLNSVFGSVSVFQHQLMYPLIIFSAVFIARRDPLTSQVTAGKLVLIAMMACSLVLAAVKPSLAIEPNYRGLIPGLHFRLWGVGSNANSIGPLALLYILLECMQPTHARWLRYCALLMATAVFLLAQSKTAWVVGLLVVPVIAWYRLGKGQGIDIRIAIALFLVFALAFAALLLVDPLDLWERMSATKLGGDALSLSGRGQIWSIALGEWHRNPIFGYGPDIWGPGFREQIAMPYAFSAHNQFLQSLSSAGVLGVVGLVAYMGAMTSALLRAAKTTRGVSVALLVMVLTRCVTETPLDLGSVMNGDFLTQVVVFSIALRTACPSKIPLREPAGVDVGSVPA